MQRDVQIDHNESQRPRKSLGLGSRAGHSRFLEKKQSDAARADGESGAEKTSASTSDASIPRIVGMPSLTGMRAFAAAVVFTCHSIAQFYIAPGETSRSLAMFLLPIGQAAVSFFFLLSGFVLMSNPRKNDTLLAFWRRRAFRVYPNHLVTWCVGLALLVISGQQVSASIAAPSLLLVHDWYPATDLSAVLSQGVNPISWSLSCEVFLYLCFPLLAWVVGRLSRRGLWLTAGVLVAVVFCVPFVSGVIPGAPLPGVNYNLLQFYFVYAAPPVRMLEFMLGMVLARMVHEKMWPGIKLWAATAFCVAGYAAAGMVTERSGKPLLFTMVAMTIVPMAVMVATAAATDLSLRPSFLRNRVLVWLGQISFAFYLVHYLILQHGFTKVTSKLQPGLPGAIGIAVVFFGICVLAAWLLYTFVERPISQWRWGGDPRGGGDKATSLVAEVRS
ncbi:acyltransferase family protein [Streptomyces noursei]|uniref:acyltransferase family protein n=1 Tax=Streptomyces noursei TaxID=1971 RepID=UPI0033F8FB8D